MIVDSFKNIEKYSGLLPYLQNGLAAVAGADELPVGRYEFEGGYFMIQEGKTKPMTEGTFEAHRKFIDVQVLLDGAEEVAWQELGDTTSAIAYDSESDKERLEGSKEHHMLITKGMFWAAFPQDAHKAISHMDDQLSFRKIVMKLPVTA